MRSTWQRRDKVNQSCPRSLTTKRTNVKPLQTHLAFISAATLWVRARSGPWPWSRRNWKSGVNGAPDPLARSIPWN